MKMSNFDYTPELYDLQINWQQRLSKEKAFFEKIFAQKKITNMLDIGCGTGRHAQFFSDYADSITAMDPSVDMINYARKFVVSSSKIKLVAGGFENFGTILPGQFDLIVCLGNTLPILGNRRNVKLALKNTRKKLAAGGLAIFQFLNFEPKIIEKNRFYPPKILSKDDKKYIFMKHFEFDKINTRADFLITQLSSEDKIENFFVNSSYFCTLRKNLFLKMAANAGFKK
ncbi:MAG: class I SAM-dependent methyltransferase, partial [Actinobacteria bacterium]|nr:class I SAM-dependent methyltransferase [Actinomycetota bacterium]